MPSSFRASSPQFRACHRSPKENDKTQNISGAVWLQSDSEELLLVLSYFLKNSVCVGFQCTKYKRAGEDIFNYSKQVRAGENCGVDTDLFLI